MIGMTLKRLATISAGIAVGCVVTVCLFLWPIHRHERHQVEIDGDAANITGAATVEARGPGQYAFTFVGKSLIPRNADRSARLPAETPIKIVLHADLANAKGVPDGEMTFSEVVGHMSSEASEGTK